MKAETVFEVYNALEYFEQKRLYKLIKDDLNKVSIFNSNEDNLLKIADNLPTIFISLIKNQHE